MKISRVLNNSCVIVLDDNEKELVLLGNGIGYAKRPLDSVTSRRLIRCLCCRTGSIWTALQSFWNGCRIVL